MVVKQIYSLIEYDEAVKTMEAGADNIGLVPMQNGGVPAHRVPIERVHRIFDECKRRGVTSVAIMLTNDPDEMIELAREVRPDILHIAGDGYAADEAFAARLKEAAPNTKLMQAVLVDDESAVDRAKKYAQYCDLILTDSGLAPDTGIGASGLTHDWSIDACGAEFDAETPYFYSTYDRFCESRAFPRSGKPVIMAGGLGPDNVAEAIEQCKPHGVDSLTKTSIKYDGGYMEKDIDKVRQFCINADAAAAKSGQ